MLHEPDAIRFASDATLSALWGGLLLLGALIAFWAEQRRTKRRDIDRVGWVPWTKIFFICALIGLTLLMMGITGWAQPDM